MHTWFRRHGWSIRRGPAHFLKTSAHAVAYLRGENTTNKILLQIERLCVAFGRCSYVGSNDDLGQPPPIRSSECKNNSSSHFSFEFRLCRPSEHNKKAREQNRPHFLKRPPIIYFSNPKTIEISTTLQVKQQRTQNNDDDKLQSTSAPTTILSRSYSVTF